MKVNTEQLESVSKADSDSAKNLKIARETGAADGFGCENAAAMTDGDKIDLVAARILEKYRAAFEELAK